MFLRDLHKNKKCDHRKSLSLFWTSSNPAYNPPVENLHSSSLQEYKDSFKDLNLSSKSQHLSLLEVACWSKYSRRLAEVELIQTTEVEYLYLLFTLDWPFSFICTWHLRFISVEIKSHEVPLIHKNFAEVTTLSSSVAW